MEYRSASAADCGMSYVKVCRADAAAARPPGLSEGARQLAGSSPQGTGNTMLSEQHLCLHLLSIGSAL